MADMMMASNSTNSSTETNPSQASGLAVGLPLFFVVLAVIIGSVAYFYFQKRKSKHTIQSMDDRQTKPSEPQLSDSDRSCHQISDSPVYENFRERPSDINASRHYSNMDFTSHRGPDDPADPYVQRYSEHDAIYSNDPTFSYSSQPDNHEEDVYIVPDA